jgi:hypothetical protein
MFKLFVTSTNVDSGTIPVSWCVSKETLDRLAAFYIREPQVVLCVSPKPREGHWHYTSREYRKVVPLKDLMAYVEFRYPGENRIYGFISFESEGRTRDRFLSKSHREYFTDILNSAGNNWTNWHGAIEEDSRDVTSVDVPAGCFAPEPPAWEQAWVNHYFFQKCIDQCQYRRRRMFAYTLQPILMFFNLLFRMLILVGGLLLGTRGATRNWAQVFMPLTYDYKELFNGIFSGGTVFIRPAKTDGPKEVGPFAWWVYKQCWLVPFMPLVLIPLLIVLGTYGMGSTACYFALVIGVAVGLLACVTVVKKISDKLVASAAGKKLWYTEDEEIFNLVCDGTDKPTKVSRLPRKHRTIKLRLSELKAKVCRPFPG